MFLAPPPRTVTPEMQQRFDLAIKEAYAYSPARSNAEQQYFHAHMHTRDAKVWFWWFRQPHRDEVRKRQKHESAAAKVVRGFDQQQKQKISNAKASLGLWSDSGLEESRQLFWQSFNSGKVFAQRQTFWDTVVNIIFARERNAISMVLELLCTAVINFTAGMVISIFAFVAQLPAMLLSYQPSWWSGLGFFVVSLIGACSVIAGFLLALWGSGTAAIYSIVYLANTNGRLEGGRGYRRPQRIHFD
ncbi:hypothetical protein WJX74_000074 [Apatococcus lobatus]|uniref:Uncharacterized protein n=1 Tax=Apatococcus lobatus TaxID=904363 RepID=A0AAW1S1L8_9CHLO